MSLHHRLNLYHSDALTHVPIELHVECFEACIILKGMSNGGPTRLTDPVVADVECVQYAVIVEQFANSPASTVTQLVVRQV